MRLIFDNHDRNTPPPARPHEVIDTIAAVGVSTGGTFRGGPRLDEALERCKEGLRHFAQGLGANAVMSCYFETHFNNQTVNVAGYGTAIRWTDQRSK